MEYLWACLNLFHIILRCDGHPRPALPTLLQISIPAFDMLMSFLYHRTNIFNLRRIHEYLSKRKQQ